MFELASVTISRHYGSCGADKTCVFLHLVAEIDGRCLEQCADMCLHPSSQLTNKFMSKIVTGDETWRLQYDPESKRQSLQWTQQTSPRPKKAHVSKSQMKTLIITFFDIKFIVHFEFILQGQTTKPVNLCLGLPACSKVG